MGYAPYESPQIAIAIRIANGYTSANAASMAADIFSYYFDLSCDFSRNVFFYYHSGADYAMMFL